MADKQRKRLTTPFQAKISSEEGNSDGNISSVDDGDDDNDDNDDDDDEEEEPEFFAPPASRGARRAGGKHKPSHPKVVSPLEKEAQFFGDSEDDDDDDIYEGVNDISDDEDELSEEVLEAHEVEAILESSDSDDAAAFINQIDGMSDFGFGAGDGRGDFSDDSSDSISDHLFQLRRVHFPVDVERAELPRQSASPLLTRALLPSALPDDANSTGDVPSLQLHNSNTKIDRTESVLEGDPYDSMFVGMLSKLC